MSFRVRLRIKRSNQSYADHPETLGKLRADKFSDAGLISPREVLVEMLRDIDLGLLKPTQLIVIWEDDGRAAYSQSSKSAWETSALCHKAALTILNNAD